MLFKTDQNPLTQNSLNFKADAAELAMTTSERNPGTSPIYVCTANDQPKTPAELSFEERDELVKLREEVQRLRMERDVLRRTSVLLAAHAK